MLVFQLNVSLPTLCFHLWHFAHNYLFVYSLLLSASVWFLFSLFHAIIVCFCRWIYPWSSMYIRHCRFFSCNFSVKFFFLAVLFGKFFFFFCTFISLVAFFSWTLVFVCAILARNGLMLLNFTLFFLWQIISLFNVFDSKQAVGKQNAALLTKHHFLCVHTTSGIVYSKDCNVVQSASERERERKGES